MNWLENLLVKLNAQMPLVTPYGWFHLLCLGIIIIGCVLLGVFAKKLSDKQNKILLITFGLILIIFEIYKQLLYSYFPSSGEWSYNWYFFPFQFCSVPMYLMLISGIVPKGKFQNMLNAFLATYGLLAGLLVMLSPGDVFGTTIGMNIQTVVWHGSMVMVGVYLLASGRIELKHKTIFKALYVFLVCIVIAQIFNLVDKNLNMFLISPYNGCNLPVLSTIFKNCPYLIFLLIYILAFSLGAYIVLLFAMMIKLIKNKTMQRKNSMEMLAKRQTDKNRNANKK
ncbi:MAG: YwaF family protein [Clostridia bacterium]